MQLRDWIRNKKKTLARYAIVGIIATVTHYGLLILSVEYFGFPILLASTVIFVLVASQNYVIHYNWTFDSVGPHTIAFPRFLGTAGAGAFLNWAIMHVGIFGLGGNYLVVQFLAIVAVIVWNYLIVSLWIFPSDPSAESSN
jgi:putative flippase GtrA